MDRDNIVDNAQGVARRAGDHPALEAAARAGYAASGLIHLLIGGIALRLALGGSGGSADQSGALHQITGQPWGAPLLWAITIGFAGLSVWQIAEAVGGARGTGKDALFGRGKAASKAVMYAALALTAGTFASGGEKSSQDSATETTTNILQMPGGPLLVALIGAVIIGVGGYHVYKGVAKKFLDDLEKNPGDVAESLGLAGYVAKGLALVIVGGFFVVAGVTRRAQEGQGLDGALTWLQGQPLGPWLLGAVALGIAAYGFYSFVRARHTSL